MFCAGILTFLTVASGAWGVCIPCRPCPKICTLLYAPICCEAPNGTTKTFSSRCAFQSFVECDNNPGWIELGPGECPVATTTTTTTSTTTTTTPSPNCGGFCPLFITKMCVMSPFGEYEEVFGNECLFEKEANCGDGTGPLAGYTFVKYGPCFPEETTSTTTTTTTTTTECPTTTTTTTTECPTTTEECPTTSTTTEKPCIVNCPLLTKVYNPVCARGPNGQTQTFENSCFFDSALQCNPKYKGWEIIYQGECQDGIATCDASVNSAKACTREYRPICAIGPMGEMKTFANRCQFDNAIIYDPKYRGWGQLCEGECSKCAFAVPKSTCQSTQG